MADPREDVDALIVRTREAHEALRDLRVVAKELRDLIREANQVKVEVMAACAVVVDNAITESIDTGLEHYSSAINKAIEDAQEAVSNRFNKILTMILDGETIESVKASLEYTEAVKKVDKIQPNIDAVRRKGTP